MDNEQQQPAAEAGGMDQAFAAAGISDADFEDAPAREVPAAEPTEPTVARDEHGRFARRDGEPEPEPEAQTEPEAPAEPQQSADPADEPPARFSADARAAWKDAPAPVKAEIRRAFSEMEGGLRQYQETYGPLREYAEMAQAGGTTLKAALDAYTGIERMLATDPKAAMEKIAANVGLTLEQIVSGERPAKPQAPEPQYLTAEQAAQVARREAEAVAVQREVNGEIERFKASPEAARYAELEADIAMLIQSGRIASSSPAQMLREAYQMAERLNPAPAAPPRPSSAAANLSVTGAPAGGSNPPRTRKPSGDHLADLDDIFREVGIQ